MARPNPKKWSHQAIVRGGGCDGCLEFSNAKT